MSLKLQVIRRLDNLSGSIAAEQKMGAADAAVSVKVLQRPASARRQSGVQSLPGALSKSVLKLTHQLEQNWGLHDDLAFVK